MSYQHWYQQLAPVAGSSCQLVAPFTVRYIVSPFPLVSPVWKLAYSVSGADGAIARLMRLAMSRFMPVDVCVQDAPVLDDL